MEAIVQNNTLEFTTAEKRAYGITSANTLLTGFLTTLVCYASYVLLCVLLIWLDPGSFKTLGTLGSTGVVGLVFGWLLQFVYIVPLVNFFMKKGQKEVAEGMAVTALAVLFIGIGLGGLNWLYEFITL